MNNEHFEQDVIDLGSAIGATKGGPMGSDDYQGSLMIRDAVLIED